MKQIRRTLLTVLCLIMMISSQAQQGEGQGGEVVFNPTKTACLTEEDHSRYQLQLSQNLELLESQGKRAFNASTASQQVLFIWPIQQADGFDFASTWGISNYLDHNPNTNQLEDWNCGERTYDTSSGYDHSGLDIYTWPFWWKQMDDDQTEVIAAQSGQIIYKNDGQYDRNCSLNGSQWNAVYVEHSDGSIAWYGHLKNGSLTGKNVGDMLSQGEYIGVIGSSGNSTGPHLHFEVYDVNNNLIDPYEGPCNNLNDSSWWSDQKEYTNPKINAILTHDAPPEFFFDECNTPEEPHVSDQFDPGDSIILAAYYADQIAGTTATYEVRDANGDITNSWSQTFNNTYFSSYWYWTIGASNVEGVWTFSVTYNGQTETREFVVGENLSITENNPAGLFLYPNPVQDVLHFKTATPVDLVIIRDAAGREVLSQSITSLNHTLDFSNLSSGVYFVTGISKKDNIKSTVQVIKE